MRALETLACRFSRRLGLDLFHPDEAAVRTRDHDRLIPRGIIAIRVAQATVEGAPALGATLGEVADATLGALDAERDGLRVLALGVAGAGQEFAEAARLDDHGRAAFLADLVGRAIRHLVLLDGPRVVALLGRVAQARNVGAEAAALHLERRAALRALLGCHTRQIVHLVDDLVDVDRFERDAERLPELANTSCQARSPSSILSSSFSMFAVKPTSKTSGNERFSTFHTVSPWGVGWKRRSFAVAYQRMRKVEMIAA